MTPLNLVSIHGAGDIRSSDTVIFRGKQSRDLRKIPLITKKRHFEDASTLEVLTGYVPDLPYWDPIEVKLMSPEIQDPA